MNDEQNSTPHRMVAGRRYGVAVAAAVALVATVAAVVVVRETDESETVGANDSQTTVARTPSVAPTSAATPTTTTAASPTTQPAEPRTELDAPLGVGSSGQQVEELQHRLTELGFAPGPIDGQFGNLTQASVWAFEKLVMQVPRAQPTGVVTDEMWRFMQQPMAIRPRRPDAATANHTEVYLPEQVVAFFVDDEPVMISHMSSGTGLAWREEVTIDVGEYGNEDGTAPLVRGEIGVSITPGGVFTYHRFVEGIRNSALGGMWDPAYFNYGIAIHGALNVPLEPASHGCIRIPLAFADTFHDHLALGDQVYVWDGVREPEAYGAQLPTFNRIDPDYVSSTTTTGAPTSPTVAPAAPAG